MIRSLAHLARWQRLLDEEIPRELALYRDRLVAQKATDAWHKQASQQCAAWKITLVAALAHADLPIFLQRYPDWTVDTIRTILDDLNALGAAADAKNADSELAARLR